MDRYLYKCRFENGGIALSRIKIIHETPLSYMLENKTKEKKKNLKNLCIGLTKNEAISLFIKSCENEINELKSAILLAKDLFEKE